MRKYFSVIILIALLMTGDIFTINNVQAFQSENIGKDINCGKCHTITVKEAGNILYQIDPGMTVTNVMESPVSGLWEVVFENNGKKGVLYIPYSKKHIIAGMVIEIATGVVDVRSMKQGTK